MPTTLLRGITRARRRTSASLCCSSVGCMPTYSGSPARATTMLSSAGMPSSSTSPVTMPYWGSSPVVNLAMRTGRAYLRAVPRPLTTLGGVENAVTTRDAVPDEATWRERRAAHEARVEAWVRPHLERREARVPHPVEDFLFTY